MKIEIVFKEKISEPLKSWKTHLKSNKGDLGRFKVYLNNSKETGLYKCLLSYMIFLEIVSGVAWANKLRLTACILSLRTFTLGIMLNPFTRYVIRVVTSSSLTTSMISCY